MSALQGFCGRAGLQVVVTASRAACAVLCRNLPENVPSLNSVHFLLHHSFSNPYNHVPCAGHTVAYFFTLPAQHQDIFGAIEAQCGNHHGQSLHHCFLHELTALCSHQPISVVLLHTILLQLLRIYHQQLAAARQVLLRQLDKVHIPCSCCFTYADTRSAIPQLLTRSLSQPCIALAMHCCSYAARLSSRQQLLQTSPS